MKPPWAKWALVGGTRPQRPLVVALIAHWQEDILRTALDPKKPYQTYKPPAAPTMKAPGLGADPRRPRQMDGGRAAGRRLLPASDQL